MLHRARRLRTEPTDAERTLWQHLRCRQLNGCRFRRQVPIGRYISDFVCFEKRLIIELDGGQHATQMDYDNSRTEWLSSQGFHVMRFWNNDVLRNMDAVLNEISRKVAVILNTPPSRPSPARGEGVKYGFKPLSSLPLDGGGSGWG
jgi:very-short-patch-repair endonuclease